MQKIIRRVIRALQNPRRAKAELQHRWRLAYTKKMGKWFQSKSYFIQSRMDIDQGSPWYAASFNDQIGGGFSLKRRDPSALPQLEPWDHVRYDMLRLLLRTIDTHHIPGEMAEVGVYKGLTAKLLHYYFPERTLHLFDTFTGFAPEDLKYERMATEPCGTPHFADTSVESALRYIAPLNDHVRVYPGLFPKTVPASLERSSFAFVHLDADLYVPTMEGLRYFYPKMAPGGMIVVHDYNAWLGARQAVDEFFIDRPEVPIPMPDKSGSALIVKNRVF